MLDPETVTDKENAAPTDPVIPKVVLAVSGVHKGIIAWQITTLPEEEEEAEAESEGDDPVSIQTIIDDVLKDNVSMFTCLV